MRRIAILGSTGSIGRQTLDVIAAHPDRFAVCGLAANKNVALLREQIERFRPSVAACGETADAISVTGTTRVVRGEGGLFAVACESRADIVVGATDGLVALRALLEAAERGVDIALANKEVAVAAGEPLLGAARASGARVLPVDSEHSAVAQCLAGERREDVRTVVLTASGGPFWELPIDRFATVTPDQACMHPTWSMGTKNTLDSATLMNKGLEVIEACRLFDLRPSQLEIVVHRQSVAHAFVIFKDGSVKSQLASPDMRLPIGYALGYPERLEPPIAIDATRDVLGLGDRTSMLSFEPMDHARFPCVRLAYRAIEAGGTCPAVLSAANEEAGRAFLQGAIGFTDIAALVASALDAHHAKPAELSEIESADAWARSFTRDAIAGSRL